MLVLNSLIIIPFPGHYKIGSTRNIFLTMQEYVIKYILRRKHDSIKEQENKRARIIHYLKDMAVNSFGKRIIKLKNNRKMNVDFHLYDFISPSS